MFFVVVIFFFTLLFCCFFSTFEMRQVGRQCSSCRKGITPLCDITTGSCTPVRQVLQLRGLNFLPREEEFLSFCRVLQGKKQVKLRMVLFFFSCPSSNFHRPPPRLTHLPSVSSSLRSPPHPFASPHPPSPGQMVAASLGWRWMQSNTSFLKNFFPSISSPPSAPAPLPHSNFSVPPP